jgi:hypothetical protein
MAKSGLREEMAGVLKELRISGESAAAFGRRRGIKPQKLSYWKRVLGASAGPRTPRKRRRRMAVAAPRFVPVELLGSGVDTAALEIHLPGGERIVFPPGGSLATLRGVVLLLRERC